MAFWTTEAFRSFEIVGDKLRHVASYGDKLKSAVGSGLDSAATVSSSLGHNLMSASKTGIGLTTAAGSGLKRAVGSRLDSAAAMGSSLGHDLISASKTGIGLTTAAGSGLKRAVGARLDSAATMGSSLGHDLISASKTGIALTTAAGSGLKTIVADRLNIVTKAVSNLKKETRVDPDKRDTSSFTFDDNSNEIDENSKDNSTFAGASRYYLEEALKTASITGVNLTASAGESLKYVARSGFEFANKAKLYLVENAMTSNIHSPASFEEILSGVGGNVIFVESVKTQPDTESGITDITISKLKLLGQAGNFVRMRLIVATEAGIKRIAESDIRKFLSRGAGVVNTDETKKYPEITYQVATGFGLQIVNTATDMKSVIGAGLKWMSEVDVKIVAASTALGGAALWLVPMAAVGGGAAVAGTAAVSTVTTAVNTGAVLGSVVAVPSLTATGVATKVGVTALGATVAVAGATVALPVLGFTSAGVAAGSAAAAVHSCIGSVSAGSVFALLQSAGAAGMAISTQAAWASSGAAFALILV